MVRLLGAVMRSVHTPPNLNVDDPTEDDSGETVSPSLLPAEEQPVSSNIWSNGVAATNTVRKGICIHM